MTWQKTRLKFLAECPIQNGLGESGGEANPDWPRYIRTTDIAGPRELRNDVFASLPPQVARRALLRSGDLLMTAAGATIGKSVLYLDEDPACYAGYLVRFRAARNVDPRFVAYWTESMPYWDQIRGGRVVSTIENFSASKYQNLRLSIPPHGTQLAIADYLDRETARLDALMAARRRMVELLEERQASWLYACLASGSDASGTVPLKSVACWVEGPGIMTVDFRDEGVPLLRIRNLVGDTVDLTGCGHLPESLVQLRWNHLRVRTGELLVSGSARSGTPVVVPREADGAVPYTGLIRMWSTSSRLQRDYLRLFLTSPMFDAQIDRLKTGVGLQHWGPYHLAQIRIPLPEVDEQLSVAAEFGAREQRLRALLQLHEESSARLDERRQALITAAVTGQLDLPQAA